MQNASWIVRPENIKYVESEDFQRLCFELIDFEVSFRHISGRVGGPPEKYRGDKGMDLSVEVTHAPRYKKSDFVHSLTEDASGITCVACKGGNNWKTGLLGDANKPAPVETIKAGGHFMMVTNHQVGETETTEVLTGVSGIIAKALGVETKEIEPRVHFFDADDLASFCAYHFVRLDQQLRALLRVPDLPGLLDFGQWRILLEQSRSLPEFSPDSPRNGIIDQLRKTLGREPGYQGTGVVWVYGPPGVGKSRLVFEAIAKTRGVPARVLVSSDYEFGRRAVTEYEVPSYNDVVLIVDECPAHEAQSLCSLFQARRQGHDGTLILIGIQESTEDPKGFPGLPIRLSPLEEDAIRSLVERELGIGVGSEPDLVQRVLFLSEGYPWFAVLLSRALRFDRTVLPHGSVHWDAAEIAIAGISRDYGGDQAKWRSEVLARAKALIAVILTQGIDWNRLDAESQKRLGDAVGSTWPEVIRAAEACWHRGIIRQRQNWKYKYITPKNLARLVAAHLLDTPWSLGNSIKEHVPELRKGFYGRLEGMELPGSLLEGLAINELRNIREEVDPFDLLLEKSPGFLPLQFIAKWQPGLTARWLGRIIESSSIEELRRRVDVRRDLMFALAHISHRRDGFEDSETSLFRLAVAENENWANNATSVWANLFMVAINLTRRKFEFRLAILKDRVEKGSAELRLLALAGLANATGRETHSSGYTSDDTIDGPWDVPTIGEVQQNKLKAWDILCALTLDKEPVVADKSRAIVAENLRSTIHWRIAEQVFEMLSEKVKLWPEKQMASLREELDSIKRYEGPALNANAKLQESFKRLRTNTEAMNYHGKLLDVVGRWSPGEDRIEMEPTEGYGKRLDEYAGSLDKKLAEEGLAPPVPLRNELDWLETDEAKRGIPFMIHVGMLDTERVLLDHLVERAKDGGVANVISAYLTGLATSGQEEVVDELLRSWRANPSFALHTLLTAWRVGPSDLRISWLVEDLQAGRLNPNAVNCLAYASWGRRATPKPIKNLIETLATFPDLVPQVTALHLILERPEQELDSLEPTLLILIDSLAKQKLTGMNDYVWEQACRLGLKRGGVKEIVEAAVSFIGATEDFGSDEHAWVVLMEAAKLDIIEVWKSIMPLIEARDSKSYRILLESHRYALISQVPVNTVMEWIGSDKRRSIIAADMCSAHEKPLNEIARTLIMKFGADSPAAHVLASRAHSTPGVVSSIAGFAKSQLDNARNWSEDSAPEVAKWGQERLVEFQRSYEAESAREEFEEKELR
ncbi:MAG: hypothetical protein LLF82_000100 [Dehalococcoides mccartyi]|uniref:hypothetical protein n=1 Tax=Dehalococcoides mccartyi TaxID=61435 RepID=UPI00242DDE3A|nr:hypothetical protein [Dehalococcoides mccartyi]MCF7634636.1 hypothetical protein [Dehalococcoides mccartyi]